MDILFHKFGILYELLNRSQKYFLVGLILAIITLFWYLTPFKSLYFVSFIIMALILMLGVISDILYIYNRVWKTTIGKSLLLLSYFFLTTLTFAIADQIVNYIVEFDSSSLNRSSTFVSILLTPLVIFVVVSFIFFMFLLLGQFYLLFITYFNNLKSSKILSIFLPNITEKYPGWSCGARFIIYPCALGIVLAVGQNLGSKYEDFVVNQTKAFIYNFEAKKFSRCVIPEGSKVVTVSSDEIIIVTKQDGKYSFLATPCEPILKK